MDHYRLEMAGLNFSWAILTNIKGTSIAPVDVLMDLDIKRSLWRGKGVASEHKSFTPITGKTSRDSQPFPIADGTIWTAMARVQQ